MPVASGRRRGLLIGINYRGTSAQLRGCINDVHKVRGLLERKGYGTGGDPTGGLVVLTDDRDSPGELQPTKANIMRGFQWLLAGAKQGDVLFFHFSGHGAQQADMSGHEEDGMDETIVPVDFKRSGQITDDEIWNQLVWPLPEGAKLTALMDCCHSGTGMDLPYTYTVGRMNAMQAGAQAQPAYWVEDTNPAWSRGDVTLFSGCLDEQVSIDSYDGYTAGGAMTTASAASIPKQASERGRKRGAPDAHRPQFGRNRTERQ